MLLENQNRKYVEQLLITLRTMDKKILFDILKNKKYNYNKRVASKRKSSLPAARFFCAEKRGVRIKWQKVTR